MPPKSQFLHDALARKSQFGAVAMARHNLCEIEQTTLQVAWVTPMQGIAWEYKVFPCY